jgi:hypothetical protein
MSADTRTKRMLRYAGVLAGVFLLGILAPLFWGLQLQRQLAEAESRTELAEARQLAALSYVEVTRNNFGVATRYSSELFDKLRQLANSPDERIRSFAAEQLRRRDAVMGLLASADPAAQNELQDLTARMLTSGSENVTRARER